jgi:iron complex outermembrane receptor protein
MKAYYSKIILALGIAWSAQVLAASSTTDTQPLELETITITASKLDQPLEKAPLAVTAITKADLEREGVQNVLDLSREAPNFNIGVNGITGGLDIGIRGITTQNDDWAGSPGIATSVDGIYVARTQGLNQGLYDLDRVEILRGPQGTLYGRNATGGAVNIVTAAPEFDGFHASTDVSYGNYDSTIAHLMVNIPVSSTFAVRIAGGIDRNDGYVDTHYATGVVGSPTGPVGPNTGNYDRTDALSGRISALWVPNDQLSIRLTADSSSNNGSPALPVQTPLGTSTYTFVEFPPPTFAPVLTPVPTANQTSPFNRIVNIGGVDDTHVWNIRTHVNYAFSDALSLVYIGGYGQLHRFHVVEASGSNVNNGWVEGVDAEHNSYQELNLKYDTEKVKWLLGADYSSEHVAGNFDINSYGPELYPNGAPQSPSGLQLNHPDNVLESYGVFTQATYSILPELRATAGLRYSHDFQAFRGAEGTIFCPLGTPLNDLSACNPLYTPADGAPNFGPQPGQYSIPNDESYASHNVSWKAGLDYDVSPLTLAYFTASTGYKAGGPANTPFASPFKPETVLSFETGLKTREFDAVRLSVAAFDMKYKNYQVTEDSVQAYLPSGIPGFPVALTNQVTVNAASATIYGLEFEGAWRATIEDRVDLSASYLHARFDTFTTGEDLIDQPGNPALGILPPTVNLSGNRMVRSPNFSGRVAYGHTFQFADTSALTASVSPYYQSMVFLREVNAPVDKQGGYALVDATVSYAFPDKRLKLEAFGKNLMDKYYRVTEFSAVFSQNSFYGDPRTYGVRVRYTF